MNKYLKLVTLGFVTALFTGVLVNASPIAANADDEFVLELHNEKFLKVEVGENFTVVLTDNNEVYTFGRNHLGQLGIGNTNVTLAAHNITESFNLNNGETIVDIDAGRDFTIALTSSNRIFTWGDNTYAQLGNETTTAALAPINVTSFVNPSNIVVKKVVAADENIVVWLENKQIIVSGRNDKGQMAQGNTTAFTDVRIANFGSSLSAESIIDVGMFASTGYVLTQSGKVFAWGDNANKQVGNNGSAVVSTPAQLTFSGLGGGEKVVSASIGVNHGVAVTNQYKTYFWGTNSNYALGDSVTLPLNTVKNTPFNATNALKYEDEDGYTYGFVSKTEDWGNDGVTDYDEVTRPLLVFAANDATIFKQEYIYRYYESGVAGPYEDPSYDYRVIGKNMHEGQSYILNDYDDEYFEELEYAGWETYDYGYALIDFGYSRTNTIWLNEEGDFTIHGSNVYGQHGYGQVSEGGEYDNTNYSENVRYFMDGIYDYLPTNLTAPLEAYFYPNNANNMTNELANQYYAIFGSWYGNNDQYRNAGLVDYFFTEDLETGFGFSEKEWSVFTADQMQLMRSIIATLFEDEIMYESWISTDDKILEELDYSGRQAADWIRYDMDVYVNYGGYELTGWDEAYIRDQAIIDLLPASVETRLNRYRELLAAVEGFEDTYLQPFLADMLELEALDLSLTHDYDIGFTYYDNYYYEYALDLGYDQIEYLLENGYEETILAIFDAYDALPEMVQLLINEWNYYGIYEELYDYYYYYFADRYSDELDDFMYDVQDDEWYWYWPLFENLEDLEALLEKINALPGQSYEWFTYVWEDQYENTYYDYDTYEYWIFLNDLLPYLKEGKPVFDQIVIIDALVVYDDDYGDYVIDLDTAALIIAMYNDLLALSEEAQALLDPEYAYWLYELALQTLANAVEDELYNVYLIEDDNGVYGLFANLEDVLAALAAFEALPEEALDYMDSEAIEYYEYLLSIKLALQEGLEVYEQIVDIEGFDYEDLTDEQLAAISKMYNDYLALSEDAQALLDPEYVEYLAYVAVNFVQGRINNLPSSVQEFEDLFNDEETKQAAIDDLLAAWSAYQALSPELRALVDADYAAHLQAMHARYLELIKPQVDLAMIGLILVHLAAGTYFAFKKRDVLVPIVKE